MTDISTGNPLLAKVKLPGRVFQLPSRGLFYDPGVLADHVNDGEIQVKPMSGLVELKVRSADLLISNKIIREICSECVPDILKPEMLLSKDVDAIFLFLLTSTYGSDKRIKSFHGCQESNIHEYTVSLDTILSKPNNKQLDHRAALYSTELPNGQLVELKPITFNSSIEMMLIRQDLARKETNNVTIENEEMENIVVKDLHSVIENVSTGGEAPIVVTDRKQIDDWIRALPKTYMDQLVRAATDASEWGFTFQVPLKCKDCGETYQHDLELNPVNFFSG